MQRVISAGIIIFRRTKEGPKFLILYHGRNYWNFPKGKMEGEEQTWQTALREVREETGLKPNELRFTRDFKTKEQFFYQRGVERVFKVVILYLAETRQAKITVSDEHEGYGWFTYSEAKHILSKYKDSLKILDNAYNFLRRGGVPSRRPNPQGPHPHVQRSGAESRPSQSLPRGREHPAPEPRH